jgi:hypothetical protein
MSDHTTPPDWITDYATSVRDLLGLGEWRIFLKMTDSPGDDDDHDGATYLDTRYLKATIQLVRDWGGDDAKMRRIIMHEHLHVALAHLDQAADRIIDLVPETLKSHAQQLYRDAEEQTIERLVRSLETSIRPSEDANADHA